MDPRDKPEDDRNVAFRMTRNLRWQKLKRGNKSMKKHLTFGFNSAIMPASLALVKGNSHAGNVRFIELVNVRISSVNNDLFMLLPAEV